MDPLVPGRCPDRPGNVDAAAAAPRGLPCLARGDRGSVVPRIAGLRTSNADYGTGRLLGNGSPGTPAGAMLFRSFGRNGPMIARTNGTVVARRSLTVSEALHALTRSLRGPFVTPATTVDDVPKYASTMTTSAERMRIASIPPRIAPSTP